MRDMALEVRTHVRRGVSSARDLHQEASMLAEVSDPPEIERRQNAAWREAGRGGTETWVVAYPPPNREGHKTKGVVQRAVKASDRFSVFPTRNLTSIRANQAETTVGCCFEPQPAARMFNHPRRESCQPERDS